MLAFRDARCCGPSAVAHHARGHTLADEELEALYRVLVDDVEVVVRMDVDEAR